MSTIKPCLDCHKPTSHGSRCPACQKIRNTMAEQRRGTRIERGYDNDWGRTSKEARKAQRFCSHCGTTSDLTTHHMGGTADDGLMVLCRSCHALLHATRRR